MLHVEETSLKGVYLVKPSVQEDKRGNFYETYNEKEYKAAGLTAEFVQDDISLSVRGVLRGMHGDPGTTKLVQCAYGSVYAVILNGDERSPDFGKWESFILSDENKHQLYIPPMYANGFYVLSDTAVYTYKQFSFKYNDPRFGIRWPAVPGITSERDG